MAAGMLTQRNPHPHPPLAGFRRHGHHFDPRVPQGPGRSARAGAGGSRSTQAPRGFKAPLLSRPGAEGSAARGVRRRQQMAGFRRGLTAPRRGKWHDHPRTCMYAHTHTQVTQLRGQSIVLPCAYAHMHVSTYTYAGVAAPRPVDRAAWHADGDAAGPSRHQSSPPTASQRDDQLGGALPQVTPHPHKPNKSTTHYTNRPKHNHDARQPACKTPLSMQGTSSMNSCNATCSNKSLSIHSMHSMNS